VSSAVAIVTNDELRGVLGSNQDLRIEQIALNTNTHNEPTKEAWIWL
jgi:hypothetical protein